MRRVPLAIPLMAGPGAITATLLLAGQARGQPLLLLGLLGVVAIVGRGVVLASSWLPTASSACLGVTGSVVLSRLLASCWPRSRYNSSSMAYEQRCTGERFS